MLFRSVIRVSKLFAMVACAACDIGCPVTVGSADERLIPVHVEVVTAESSIPVLVVLGAVESDSSRLLAFRFEGRVARVRVAEGDRVAAGDIIAEFDPTALAGAVGAAGAAVERAQARLMEAERRSGRRQSLFALASDTRGAMATNTVESAMHASEIRLARAMLAGAEARLVAGVLRAPVAGIVDRLYIDGGGVAVPGAPVVRLLELAIVAVRAAVPRALLPLVRVGGSAEVRFGSRNLPGSIARIDITAGSADGSVPFEVLAENVGFALRPGVVAEVRVKVPDREAEFSVPLASVRRGIDARPFVFVVVKVGEGERIERRRIILGGLREGRAAVIAGLVVGDRVVSLGQGLVTVGDWVKVVGEGP
jgi:RND family efflux transporter MFP subunit